MSLLAIKDMLNTAVGLIDAARVTGGSPYNATSLDTANLYAMKAVFRTGTWTDGTHALKLQESTDNATFTDVVAADQVGTLTSITAGSQNNTNQQVSYIGKQRYVRMVVTSSGTTTGAVMGCHYESKKRKQP